MCAASHRSRSSISLTDPGFVRSFQAGYAAFMQALFQAAGTASLKLASALPWEADRYADVYYSVTLRSLAFNVLRTYDEFYSSLTTVVRPLNPLVAMAAPFNATTKTIVSESGIHAFKSNVLILLSVSLHSSLFSNPVVQPVPVDNQGTEPEQHHTRPVDVCSRIYCDKS